MLFFSLTITFGNSISYTDEEDYEDVYEPLCDIDFDGEVDCNKFLSFDLGYSISDRKVQIRRILGLAKISLKSNLFPIISTVYMDKHVAKQLKKNNIQLFEITRDLKEIMKWHKTYKNKKNVVGRDLKISKIKSKKIFNSGEIDFCRNIKKLIK